MNRVLRLNIKTVVIEHDFKVIFKLCSPTMSLHLDVLLDSKMLIR